MDVDDLIKFDDQTKEEKITRYLTSDENLAQKTNITRQQAEAITQLEIVADIYNFKPLKDYVYLLKQNLVSVDGMGRRSLVEILKGNLHLSEQEGLADKLFGRGGGQ